MKQGNLKKKIEKARKIHNDFYNYDWVIKYEPNSVKDKVIITCPIHGDFWTTLDGHVNAGHGCPKCAGVSSCADEKLKICKEVTNGCNYTFEKFNYVNSKTKVVITCHEKDTCGREHGDFTIRLDHLLNGQRCPKCSGKILDKDEFVARAELVHGTRRYDYSLVSEYHGNSNDSGLFICHEKDEFGNEHGIFKQQYYLHLNGCGCPKCSGRSLWNTEYFIKKAHQVHGDRYCYDKFEYIKYDTPSVITCPIHGDFLQSPSSHLHGAGCPNCKHSRMEESLSLLFDRNEIYHEMNVKYRGLGRQTIDFFLPSKHVYIECQGEQHYQPTKFMRGMTDEDAEKEYIERVGLDKEKYNAVTNDGFKMLYYVDTNSVKLNNDVDVHDGWYVDKLVFTSKIKLLDYISTLPNFEYMSKEIVVKKKKNVRKRVHWTYELCKAEAEKYNTRTEFQKGCQPAYVAARRNGWLDEFMESKNKPKNYWSNKENITAAFHECMNEREFRKKYSGAYSTAVRKGWLNELLGRKCVVKGYWQNRENVLNLARLCKNRHEFKTKHLSAYSAAVRNGWIHELVSEVFPNEKPRGYWKIKKNVLEAAKTCTHAKEFQKKYSGAYCSAFRNGWLSELVYKD